MPLTRPLISLGLALALALPLPVAAQERASAGSYLAAREAFSTYDFPAAVDWFAEALQGDPTNPELIEAALAAHLAMGDRDAAGRLARQMAEAGHQSQIGNLALLADLAGQGDYAGFLAAQAEGRKLFPLFDLLVQAWAEVGVGKMSEASVTFDRIIAERDSAPLGLYHKALALAQTGDFEGAEALFADPRAEGITGLRRGVVARVQILSQLERGPEAVALIDARFGAALDPGMADLRRRAAAGEPIPFDLARDAGEGMAEAFFTWATLSETEDDLLSPLLNARVAAGLRADHIEALLMVARLLDDMGQHDLAMAVYGQVPDSDPAAITAGLGRANAAAQAGRPEEAVTILQALDQTHPGDRAILTNLGDAWRISDNCAEAIKAYSAAIATLDQPGPGDWPLFFRRGGCANQIGDWPAAEADLKQALALAPNEPRVLNELGYSWIDRGENLEEALDMVRRAVAAAPDQGFILDSLAWAYFRLGRYEEAVAPQERASLLMPVDPIVTDHLGDIYWMVGRKREAEFQWHRALSFNPTEKDAARIQRKLELGLDAVMEAEKANGG